MSHGAGLAAGRENASNRRQAGGRGLPRQKTAKNWGIEGRISCRRKAKPWAMATASTRAAVDFWAVRAWLPWERSSAALCPCRATARVFPGAGGLMLRLVLVTMAGALWMAPAVAQSTFTPRDESPEEFP